MLDGTDRRRIEVYPMDEVTTTLNKKQHVPRTILREFGLNTSTHGIPGIARSESVQNRLYWTICLLAFTGIMIYFVTESIRSYFKYPTQTVIIMDEPPILTYPGVSFCNYSPLRYDHFIGPFLNYTNQLKVTNTTNTSMFTVQQAKYIEDFLHTQLNNNYSLNDYFYPLESILLSCRYNDLNCSSDDFTSFITPQYGLCYTFNAKSKTKTNATLYKIFDNGRYGVLNLELYIHRHQYVPYFSKGAGVVIAVHDNQQMPLIYFTGYYLRPGQYHRLTYSIKTKYRLGKGYTECENTIPPTLQGMFDQFSSTDYKYGQMVCNLACMQTYVYDQCGCIDPNQWIFRYLVPHGTANAIQAPVCNQNNSCYREATAKLADGDYYWSIYCNDCTVECSTAEFILRVSSITAILDWSFPDLKKQVESLGESLPINWSHTWQQDIEKNYVAIEVITETATTEKYNEQASMSGTDLLSNVGGQTGLWIGISFLSFMEILEMCYRLIRYYCNRLYCRIRPHPQTN